MALTGRRAKQQPISGAAGNEQTAGFRVKSAGVGSGALRRSGAASRSRTCEARLSLAAILLFTIFRGSVPFLTSTASPASAHLRVRRPAVLCMSIAGGVRSMSNNTSGARPRAVVEILQVPLLFFHFVLAAHARALAVASCLCG